MATLTKTKAIDIVNSILSCEPILDTRFVESMRIGQFARQGDIYLVRAESIPEGSKSTLNRQLANGNTQGSRHVVGSVNADIYNPPNFGQIITTPFGKAGVGPAIESKEHMLIEHPEHAHISLPPGIYQVYCQYDQSTDRVVKD